MPGRIKVYLVGIATHSLAPGGTDVALEETKILKNKNQNLALGDDLSHLEENQQGPSWGPVEG